MGNSMANSIRVRCPATSANLGAGFDVFGIALRKPYDVIEVERAGEGVEIEVSGFDVPSEPSRNTGGYVALRMLEEFGLRGGVRIRILKGIRPGSGLGSSAATAAGVAFAINRIFALGLSRGALVRYAAEGEIVSAGVPHMDNVAPAIYGWFTMVASQRPLRVYSIRPPRELGILVMVPEGGKRSTEEARRVLPRKVPLEKAVRNVACASTLAVGMALGDLDMIKVGMEDFIVEPARAEAGILRAFRPLKEAARKLGVSLAASGAGPAVLVIAEPSERKIRRILEALGGILEEEGIQYSFYITELGPGVEEMR